MSNNLQEVWHQVEALLDQGISVIPVRDKDDGHNVAKSPYSTWKQYQSRRIEKSELWKEMEHYNTCAVGILGGKISGNLYIIDIDVKYKKGIDALLFQDFKKLYPDIFEKVRIHKSPSSGYHILYKCESEVEGNLKLAGRPATPEELQAKPKNKFYNFLESRGEGGYVLAPPSLGYKVVKETPIPILTIDEHQSIINLCRSYNEIVKIEKVYKPTKSEESYYDENPFEDFNNRVDPSSLMHELGWAEIDKNSDRFIWYTRPGKTKGISMSFNRQKRFFFCFTASVELEENHGYTPSNLVSVILFGGDKRKTYAYLVQKGYGKVKPKIEEKQVKLRVLSGQKLPANFSEAAQQAAQVQAQLMQDEHPFGIFWEPDDEGKMKISREGLYKACDGLGFKIYEDDLYRVLTPFIHRQSKREFFDTVKAYIHDEDPDVLEDICNAYEQFMQVNGAYTIDRLRLLDESMLLKDTRESANKFYRNCYLEITDSKTTIHQYEDLTQLVFFDRAQQRDYKPFTGGAYVDFLKNATGLNDHLQKSIGYLCHEYKDETMAYIIVCVETCPDPKLGGGSGKNVFCDLMRYSTSYTSKPGSQSKLDEKFFQTWNGQKVFGISDLPEDFDFSFLKELSSGTMVWKRLFKNEVVIGPDKAPKILTQTNFSYKVTDGGLKRRIIPIEFTEFFTRAGGVDVHFGKHFPNDWSEQDWNGYDTFIAECIQKWLGGGRKLSPVELSGTGWEKQFHLTYGQTIPEVIQNFWKDWTIEPLVFISNETFKNSLEKYYVENSISPAYRPSMSKLNKAIEDYAKKMNVGFNKDTSERGELGKTIKGKTFYSEAPF